MFLWTLRTTTLSICCLVYLHNFACNPSKRLTPEVLEAMPRESTESTLPRIRTNANGKGFVLESSEKPFIPWGFNYAKPGKLLEDFWESDWAEVEADFKEMKELGANVVRIHLQVGKFMTAADQMNEKALERLTKIIELAEKTGLYLDVTGLACYRPTDVPKWYDPLSEKERWATQVRFWEAIAKTCSKSSAIFCYDLINEPLSPAEPRKEWYSGKLFGGFDFLQYIALDRADRKREEIPPKWIKMLTTAIRTHDSKTLITVGQLPTIPKWGHFSGFLPEKVAPELDFISVHIYPEKDNVAEAIKTLKQFAVGKPLVIEETFPLTCSAKTLQTFLKQSRGIAHGWIGHYEGHTIHELRSLQEKKTITIAQSMWLSWLELFQKLGEEMTKP